MKSLSPFLLAAAISTSALAGDAIDTDRFAHERAKYLCQWSKKYPENPVPLLSCDSEGRNDISDMEAWWQWMFNSKMNAAVEIRGAFLEDWDASRSPTLEREHRLAREKAAAQQKEDDARLHAKVLAEREVFVKDAPKLSSEYLCSKSLEADYSAPASEELKRRGAFKPSEWSLISAREISIGMSELALLCSWGAPTHVNRTVTAAGTHKQYVYPSGALVYVDGGRVTGLQDQQ